MSFPNVDNLIFQSCQREATRAGHQPGSRSHDDYANREWKRRASPSMIEARNSRLDRKYQERYAK